MSEPTPDPRQRDRTIPAALAAVCLRAMAKSREERYQSPQELLQDLEHLRQNKPLLHALIVPAPAGASALPSPPPTAATAAPGPLAPATIAHGPTMPLPTAARPAGGFAPGSAAGGLLGFTLLFKVMALVIVVGVLYAVYKSMSGFHGDSDAHRAAVEGAPWASSGGSDDFGRWAELPLGGSCAMRMRWIPSGTFTMGSPSGESGRGSTETPHSVTISHGFWLAETACTQSQWEVLHGNGGDNHPTALPQTGIDLQDCEGAVKSLSQRIAPAVARLPTEAEWEYACRAGSGTPFFCGKFIDGFGYAAAGVVAAAWHEHAGEPNPLPAIDAELAGRSGDADIGPHAVGKLRPNAWGLFDMHGNVLQWCEDAWDGQLPLPSAAQTDPLSTEGVMGVGRGGSWHQLPEACRSAARTALPTSAKEDWLGMRILIGDAAGGGAASSAASATP